jgi:hypothetical protein
LIARAAGVLDLRGIETLPLRPRHFVACRVLLALQPFDLGQQAPAPRFERRQFVELAGQVDASLLQTGTDGGEIVAEVRRIEHGRSEFS